MRLEDIGHKTSMGKDTSSMKQGLFISIALFSGSFVIGNVADHSKAKSNWVWILMSMIWVWFATVVYLHHLTTSSSLEMELIQLNSCQINLLKKKYGILLQR